MNKRLLRIAIVMLGLLPCLHCAHAQTKIDKRQTAIPTPDFSYQVMFVNDDNELIALDKTGLSVDQTNKAGKIFRVANLAGKKVFYKADGCCAKVSHKGRPADRYIVRVEPGIDPESLVELAKFEEKENSRRLPLSRVTMGTAISGHTAADMEIYQLHFKKVSDGVYMIAYEEQLPDGEYVFTVKNVSRNETTSQMTKHEYEKGYCFSVRKNG